MCYHLNKRSNGNMSKFKKELRNSKVINACAKQFEVVGDPTRLKICYLLCNHPELSVTDIANDVEISISAVSHSLKKLKSLKFVKSRRDFRTIYYSWKDKSFEKILKTQLG